MRSNQLYHCLASFVRVPFIPSSSAETLNSFVFSRNPIVLSCFDRLCRLVLFPGGAGRVWLAGYGRGPN